MTDSLNVVHSFVTPVILISAIGLFCLGLYSRMAAVVNRMRSSHREHFDVVTQLSALESRGSAQRSRLERRAEHLKRQSVLLYGRARLLRNSLVLLLGAVLALLLCSLTLGFLERIERLASVPVIFLTVGIFAMIVGVGLAIRELFLSLDPVRAEGLTLVVDDAHSPCRTAE